jgi:hypothetical protein
VVVMLNGFRKNATLLLQSSAHCEPNFSHVGSNIRFVLLTSTLYTCGRLRSERKILKMDLKQVLRT